MVNEIQNKPVMYRSTIPYKIPETLKIFSSPLNYEIDYFKYVWIGKFNVLLQYRQSPRIHWY